MAAEGKMIEKHADMGAKPLLNYKGGFLSNKKADAELQYISLPINENMLTKSPNIDPVSVFAQSLTQASSQLKHHQDKVVYFSNHNCKVTGKIPAVLNNQNNTNQTPMGLLSVAVQKSSVIGMRTKNQRTLSINDGALLGDATLFREVYFPTHTYSFDETTGVSTLVPVQIPAAWGEQKKCQQGDVEFIRVLLRPEFLRSVKHHIDNQKPAVQSVMSDLAEPKSNAASYSQHGL